ncbi:MAG TPA: hypothetical protein VEX18_10285 [Polyangiaceae bacterium]|nr:hypothetical protein [Polyangiaceae bacterium]
MLNELFGVTLVIVLIAQDATDPPSAALQSSASSVLGAGARVHIEHVPSDPPDEKSLALVGGADGVVELSWSEDRSRARLHCYSAARRRWVDREISFGDAAAAEPAREAFERGRLLGFALAGMFTEEEDDEEEKPAAPVAPPPAQPLPPKPRPAASTDAGRSEARSLEFAGIMSSGIAGTASGLGAMAAVRFVLTRPFSLRAFVAGRAGSIPEAQASTQTGQGGVGLSVALLPSGSRWHAGARFDGMMSYFTATHLSEDDVRPDRRDRWLPAADLLAEGGLKLTGGALLHVGAGFEAAFGATEVFTHGNRVAIVPPLRAVAELGFRSFF